MILKCGLPHEAPAAGGAKCGAEGIRTHDPLLAKQVLYQLSYSPSREKSNMGQGRVELPTSRLSGVHSNHLSYWPKNALQKKCYLLVESPP